ncbi:putative lysyl-tRNA synthetase [Oceanicola granulosus HTCC2516]|uniref:Putative lysyl-tRNA synthetase n=1 Tax=Oceanicola granulosus (strain ATCC BAA-861 / DSM 15982 / KCTC 12143 / HTCC2516) TaxID=314256 RepID=Q2CKD2_OCEGH|nr:EF-P lysine aminoacylase EpmA [Oceanicola granulosus]EAR52857.1 putative lysyl-tRNA synthetase [Oceanicola granulosus HTCC2516]
MSSWWDKRRHTDRRPLLLTRNRIQAALRAWFADRGFTEIDPAYVVPSPGNEIHLHALPVTLTDADLETRQAWLHTSPEFAMKKLLAAGEEKIFTFSRVWRDREAAAGALHRHEFTMLEWYRADAPYEQLMDDCEELLAIACEAAGTDVLSHRGETCMPSRGLERLSVADAFLRQGIDLLATIRDGQGDLELLLRQGETLRGASRFETSWSDLFSMILTDLVAPGLGRGRATILDRYPAPEAALARRAPDDPRVAERFELFACGVELANGFGELTDPVEQRARFKADMATRERLYGERYPIDEDFLAALADMPPASGIALGFDRLVMLATGAPRLSDVIWTPV